MYELQWQEQLDDHRGRWYLSAQRTVGIREYANLFEILVERHDTMIPVRSCFLPRDDFMMDVTTMGVTTMGVEWPAFRVYNFRE